VTLGTVFNTTVDLLRTLVAGVAALDVEVLVTTGQTVDPAILGPQPAHVHAASFVPRADVLAAAAAVVCHAGVGTVYGALWPACSSPYSWLGELVCVPVVDRSEELDVADHDVVPVPDQQGALIPLPEPRLRILPPRAGSAWTPRGRTRRGWRPRCARR
jgi:hypothetical protein